MNFKERIIDFLEKDVGNAGVVSVDYGLQASYKLMAIHVAASYIANAISKCEIKFFRNGKPQKDKNTYKLNVEPNPNYNGSRFWNKAVMKMLTQPNGALIVLLDGNIYVADDFYVEKYPLIGNTYSSVVIDDYSLYRSFKESEVLHLQLEDKNVKALIDGMYSDYGRAISYAAESFVKSNGEKYKLKIQKDKIGDLKFNEYYEQTLKAGLQNFIKSGSGVYPENSGYSLEEFKNRSQTKDSSDLISLRKDIFTIAGQAYKIPQSMMDGNINNLEAVISSFLTFSVEPCAAVIDDELNRKFCTELEYNKGTHFKVDTKSIPYVSILSNAGNAGTLIANTVASPEELRDIFGFDYIDKEYLKTFYVTKNNSKAEDVLNGTAENGKE